MQFLKYKLHSGCNLCKFLRVQFLSNSRWPFQDCQREFKESGLTFGFCMAGSQKMNVFLVRIGFTKGFKGSTELEKIVVF